MGAPTAFLHPFPPRPGCQVPTLTGQAGCVSIEPALEGRILLPGHRHLAIDNFGGMRGTILPWCRSRKQLGQKFVKTKSKIAGTKCRHPLQKKLPSQGLFEPAIIPGRSGPWTGGGGRALVCQEGVKNSTVDQPSLPLRYSKGHSPPTPSQRHGPKKHTEHPSGPMHRVCPLTQRVGNGQTAGGKLQIPRENLG